jgi:hypothetical protein
VSQARLPDHGPAAAVYRAILDALGEQVDELGPENEVVAHWPFVGTNFRGLMIAGQALDGWDADVTPARWRLEEMRRPESRERLLRGTQEWARHRPEPIWEVVQRGNRRGRPFWDFSRRIVPMFEPANGSVWYSRYAWWNVYPVAPRRGSPYGLLKDLQRPLVGKLFWEVVEELGVDRILLVAGKDWWWEVRDLLGLRGLRPGSKPVIASGEVRGVSVVATYHPGAHIRGLTRDAFAGAVAAAAEAPPARDGSPAVRRSTCAGRPRGPDIGG